PDRKAAEPAGAIACGGSIVPQLPLRTSDGQPSKRMDPRGVAMRDVRPIFALLLTLALPAAARAADTAPPASTPVVTPAGTLTAIEAMTSTVLQEGQSSFSGLAIRARFQPPQLMK